MKRTIVWYRSKDLRVRCHAPLAAAAAAGQVLPLFVLDNNTLSPEVASAAPHRTQYLLGALSALADHLAQLGVPMLVVRGDPLERLLRLIEASGADHIFCQRYVEPSERTLQDKLAARLAERLRLFDDMTLAPAGSVLTQQGTPYRVFTPFHRAITSAVPEAANAAPPLPRALQALGAPLPSVPIPTLQQLGISRNSRLPTAGESEAQARLWTFLDGPIFDYHSSRDRLDQALTSHLSVDLNFGTLAVHDVYTQAAGIAGDAPGGRAFLRQLVWRDFTHHLLWHYPELLHSPFQPRFEGFPYQSHPVWLDAWKYGKTGYPIIDAAARQLMTEGYMHNRARMLSASFLTKHLLQPYKLGEEHFMTWLVDADLAQNNFGWQWSAGCGSDPQPYFRIFNPVTNSRKFDPKGTYIKRYLPELAGMSSQHVHTPWLAPPGERPRDDIYPRPVVDHAAARQKFLALAAAHLKVQ